MSKIVVIAIHVIIAAACGLFMGWASSIDGPVGIFAFVAGASIGVVFYVIFVITMLILLQTFGGRDE